MSASTDLVSVWLWPWEAARTIANAFETVHSANDVVAARLPILFEAIRAPQAADHAELRLMLSEKSQALRQTEAVFERVRRETHATLTQNTRDLGRAAAGSILGPMEWWKIGERNLRLASSLNAVPAAALAPMHLKATANARRLKRKRST